MAMAVGSPVTTSLVYNIFVSRLTPLHLALGSSCHIHSRKFWRRILRIGVCCIAAWNIKCKCGSNCAVRWSAYSPPQSSTQQSAPIFCRGFLEIKMWSRAEWGGGRGCLWHLLTLFLCSQHWIWIKWIHTILFIQLQEGFMQRSNNVTSHHLCSKVVMSGSKRNQTVK